VHYGNERFLHFICMHFGTYMARECRGGARGVAHGRPNNSCSCRTQVSCVRVVHYGNEKFLQIICMRFSLYGIPVGFCRKARRGSRPEGAALLLMCQIFYYECCCSHLYCSVALLVFKQPVGLSTCPLFQKSSHGLAARFAPLYGSPAYLPIPCTLGRLKYQTP